MHGAKRKTGGPREPIGNDILGVHTQFYAPCAHVAKVSVLVILTSNARSAYKVDEVERVTLVQVDGCADAIVEHSQFNTQVQLVHFFPSQVAIFKMQDVELILAIVKMVAIYDAALVNGVGVDGLFVHLGRESVTGAKC